MIKSRCKVKNMQRYHENRMNLRQAGANSPVIFDCKATLMVAYLAQAVFVNLNSFRCEMP
jgi:hypothetical protein